LTRFNENTILKYYINLNFIQMRKVFALLIFVTMIFMFSFCEKKTEVAKEEPFWKSMYPNGREVTFTKTGQEGDLIFAILTFVDNGEQRKVEGTWNSELNKFTIAGKERQDIQWICHCNSCSCSWAPNMNIQHPVCMPCPCCPQEVPNPYYQITMCDGDGGCLIIFV
jgi:hypothetical protein